jgi:hypothetical protein
MDDPADVSCQNRPGWDLVDGCVSTRNPVPLFEVMAVRKTSLRRGS